MARAGTCVLAAIALAAFATGAGAATNEVRFCGRSHGYSITAGDYPAGGIPRTSCRFARATFRKVRGRVREGGLGRRFHVRVRHQRLHCRQSDPRGASTIYCRNPRRFVLLYRTG